MFPQTTPTTVVMPEKLPLKEQKDTAVVYMVEDQINSDISRWQFKRAKICACTVVITTLILVAGTLGAIYIVLRSQQGTSETATVSTVKEPLSDNNSPLGEEPFYNPPIKIDDGALWPSKIPVTPDLVAVDGLATVSLFNDPATVSKTSNSKPDTDETIIDPEEKPIFDPVISFFSSSSSSDSVPYHERSYVRRTYVSSSFPYDGFYMRGGQGDPPPSHGEDSFPEQTEEASGDMDSDLEGSAEEDPSDSSSSSSDPDSSSSYSDPYVVSE